MFWPARNQSAEQANAAWNKATTLAQSEGSKILTMPQRQRMEEIILWIQGTRALLRDDVAEALKLTPSQRTTIGSDLEKTQQEVNELRKRAAAGESPGPLEEKARELKLAEQRRVLEKLTEDQRRSWLKLVGPSVDVSKLGQVTFRAPELIAATGEWLNGSASPDHRERRVTAVHFFANGCINCQRNYEHYRSWDKLFRDQGLVIVGIHTPETKAEYDVGLLKRRVAEAGFQFPILVDNEKKNWSAWGNSMWPSVYLIDQQGRIRYWWYGELNWQGADGEKRMRARIAELLAESKPSNSNATTGVSAGPSRR
jgi:peroxiredoxin